MTVHEYCCRVQLLLGEADVCPAQHELHRRDQEGIRRCIAYATTGHDDWAREFARAIAERWELPV